MNLYFFVYSIVILLSCEAKEFHKVVKNYKSIIEDITALCISESKVNPTLIHNMLDHGEYVDDRALKCYLKCIYLNTGMINENGDISEEAVKENAGVEDERIRQHVVEACNSVSGQDLCEKAFKLSKCTYDTVKSWHPS